jgi:hypothetical protein
MRVKGSIKPPLILLPALLLCSPAASSCAEHLPDLAVADLWDAPHNLRAIAAEGSTLFFICDTAVKECREGAVFFDNRSSEIQRAGVLPVFIFRGDPADIRTAVLKMDLASPVYIDQGGRLIEKVLEHHILPALVLAAPDGSILETVYGGGESLAGNIETVLEREPAQAPVETAGAQEKGTARWWKYAAIAAGAAAIALIAILN